MTTLFFNIIEAIGFTLFVSALVSLAVFSVYSAYAWFKSRYIVSLEFKADKEFVAILPAINLNLHSGSLEFEFIIFSIYVDFVNKSDLAKYKTSVQPGGIVEGGVEWVRISGDRDIISNRKDKYETSRLNQFVNCFMDFDKTAHGDIIKSMNISRFKDKNYEVYNPFAFYAEHRRSEYDILHKQINNIGKNGYDVLKYIIKNYPVELSHNNIMHEFSHLGRITAFAAIQRLCQLKLIKSKFTDYGTVYTPV